MDIYAARKYVADSQAKSHQAAVDTAQAAAVGVGMAFVAQQFPRATRILGWLAFLSIVGGIAAYLVARYVIYKY